MYTIRLIIYIIFLSVSNMQEFDGYTLFTPFSVDEEVATTILINNEYDILHTWSHDFFPASMPYLLQDNSIIYPYKVQSPTMFAGGVGGGVQKLSWNGDVLWNYTLSNNTYQHHHDVEPLPNENVLMIAWERKSAEEAYNAGRTSIENSLNEMWSEAILEIEAYTGNVVWEWHLWDHLIQDVNPELSNYGIIMDHPELFDVNCGDVGTNAGGPQQPNGDWMHMNSIHYNPILDQIVLSSRLQSEIYIIDHSTTSEEAASHNGGNSEKGGDILYRWGNPQNYDRGSNIDQLLFSQHSVNWIPQDFPGENNIILFNNFHSETHSSVIELIPPIDNFGNYIITDNQSYGPISWEWIYTCDILVPMQGGAFRLSNGNTIITQTHKAKMIEVDESGNNVWEYTYSTDQIDDYWIARANKYSVEYFENLVLGDINQDGILNILDIVMIVNIVLSSEFNESADLNSDGIVNVLDIVQLVNIILE